MAVHAAPRRLALLGALALAAVGCSLDGGTELPEEQQVTNPRNITYAQSFVPEIALNSMRVVDSGLFVQDFTVGIGDSVVRRDTVRSVIATEESQLNVNYRLWLPNGAQVDSSRDGNGRFGPVQFALARTIRGWQRGLQGMRVGGRRRLVLSPLWGYGFAPQRNEQGQVLIPANSVLVFDVTLNGISRATP
ncbi:MAG: FKBP-type peptidyl-prolyl cis-trans isomerase [Gemmatimonadaceae bacterium]|jgi:FKBP-type peptidyl-prolyl cis-trans isomerase|nr:FKBP-type peptidyl-prolyl cis-trans isomerase [Gemmatimonadaceae bacterium]